MHLLKDTEHSRIVGIPVGDGNAGMVKYQVQRRFGTTAFETIAEVTIVGSSHDDIKGRPSETLSVSDLQLLLTDAQNRLTK